MAAKDNLGKSIPRGTIGDTEAPLVDEVLDAVEARQNDEDETTATSAEEMAAIGAEIERIRESVSLIAQATSHYVKRRVAESSTDVIAQNPIRGVLIAAFIGFCYGRLSR